MNLKRVAGFINLFAATVFIAVGISSRRSVLIVIGAFFLLIGFLRLRQAPPGSPPS
jgi:hypothetical protein